MTTLDNVIDISHHQGENIDFNKLKASGVAAVIHKCTQGYGWLDDTYAAHEQAAKKAGLLWAAYCFGTNASSGNAQARYLLRNCGPWVRVALDFEPLGNETSQYPLGDQTMTISQALDFCETIEATTGRPTIVYAGSRMFPDALQLQTGYYGERPLWFPQYNDQPDQAPSSWPLTLWQYSKSGSVGGISPCDMDRFYGTMRQLRQLFAQ
jgi:lysozyme